MTLTVATVLKSGGVFTPVWVDRINRQIKRHIRPDRIVCLTDMDVKSCEAIPLKHNWPGWFSKIELFRPDLFDGPCVFFDLDSLILDDLPFQNPMMAFWQLVMLSDFYRPAIPASGMMLWEPDACTHIYEKFAKNPECKPGLNNADGAIIGKFCRFRIQKLWPGLVGSYKADDLKDGPKGFRVCCWHGRPKFPDLPPDNWARKVWEDERP